MHSRFQGTILPIVHRTLDIREVQGLLRRNPITAILGARQVGKTTLAKEVSKQFGSTTMFDLENPADTSRLQDPMLALQGRKGLVILDEIQLRPDLFPILRVLADRKPAPARFLVLGSASPDLMRRGSESLAGRIAYYELGGLSITDVGAQHADKLWIRGGFPRSFLATSAAASMEWRHNFIRTFLERDLPQLGIRVAAATMRRFWIMLAHYHAQIWNSSECARSFGVSDHTVRNYIDLLAGALVVRKLQPWHENISKRQVKAPKVYISDSGLLHALLGLPTQLDVESHPKLGASWEGFQIEQILRHTKARNEECFFWATHGGAELDLLIVRGRHRYGFEIKRTVLPTVTSSVRSALEDLKLTRLYVVHAGSESFPLSETVHAVSAHRLTQDLKKLATG